MTNKDRKLDWQHTIAIGPLDVDFSQGLVMKSDGTVVQLSEHEQDLLIALDPYNETSKEEIARMARIHPNDVENAIHNLKQKLRTDKNPIITSSTYKISGDIELE
jgi:hypothetical protein